MSYFQKSPLWTIVAYFIVTCLLVVPTLADDGYWVFDSYSQETPDPKCQGARCTVSAEAMTKGAKMDVNCTDINGKPYGYHGHFAWTYQNLSGTLLPGQKIDFQGTVSNLSGKDCGWTGTITQGSNHPNSGSLAILGTDPSKSRTAGSSAVAKGTWVVPKGPPMNLPDGQPSKLVLTFRLGFGGGTRVSKFYQYRWQPGQAEPGAQSQPLPPEDAGVPENPQTPVTTSKIVFDTFNGGGVGNSPSMATSFTVKSPFMMTQIQTYHWNNGKGSSLGTIALRDQNGRLFGPWAASGTAGQGGVPNAFWTVKPGIELAPGTYTVVDSQPSTWSTNAASGKRGFVQVSGYSL
jgi:hypothetical protein